MAEVLAVVLVSSAPGYLKRRTAIRRSWFRFLTEDSSCLSAEQRRKYGRACAEQRESLHMALTAQVPSVLPGRPSSRRRLRGRTRSVRRHPSRGCAGALLFLRARPVDYNCKGAQESYDNLNMKLMAGMAELQRTMKFSFVMHADDDSFVRLDLLLPERRETCDLGLDMTHGWTMDRRILHHTCPVLAELPRSKLYWGYMWNMADRCSLVALCDAADCFTLMCFDRLALPNRQPTAKSYMPL